MASISLYDSLAQFVYLMAESMYEFIVQPDNRIIWVMVAVLVLLGLIHQLVSCFGTVTEESASDGRLLPAQFDCPYRGN